MSASFARRRSTRTLEGKSSQRRPSLRTSPSCSPNPCGHPRKLSVCAEEQASVSPLPPDCGRTLAPFDPFDEDEEIHCPLIASPTAKSVADAQESSSPHNTTPGAAPPPLSPLRHRQAHHHQQDQQQCYQQQQQQQKIRHTHEHQGHRDQHRHHSAYHRCAPQKPLSWFQQLRLKVYKAVFFRAVPSWCSKTLAEFSAVLIGAHASDGSSHQSGEPPCAPPRRASACAKEAPVTADGTPILEGFFIAAVQQGLCDAKLRTLALGGDGLAEAFHHCCEELHSLLWSFLRATASEPTTRAAARADPASFVAAAKNLQHVLANALHGCASLSADTRAAFVESLHYAFAHLTDAHCVRCWLGHAANEPHLRAVHSSLTQYLQSC